MSATADDLATYLGIDNIDTDRATLLLSLATALCTSVVDPLPDGSDVVVLSAAGRAYTNPSGITNELAGPYSVTRPSGGVYLTKSERAALRRLGGGGGAFSINMLDPDRFPECETTP